MSSTTENIWGPSRKKFWSDSTGEWGGYRELIPPWRGCTSRLSRFLAAHFPATEENLQLSLLSTSAIFLVFMSIFLVLLSLSGLPTLFAKNHPCLLGVNNLCVIEADFGGEPSQQTVATEQTQTSFKAAKVTSSTRSWPHSDVCWLPATAFWPEQQSRTIRPYKCKVEIVFWLISHYQILNLCIWHNHCFIACVLF